MASERIKPNAKPNANAQKEKRTVRAKILIDVCTMVCVTLKESERKERDELDCYLYE